MLFPAGRAFGAYYLEEKSTSACVVISSQIKKRVLTQWRIMLLTEEIIREKL